MYIFTKIHTYNWQISDMLQNMYLFHLQLNLPPSILSSWCFSTVLQSLWFPLLIKVFGPSWLPTLLNSSMSVLYFSSNESFINYCFTWLYWIQAVTAKHCLLSLFAGYSYTLEPVIALYFQWPKYNFLGRRDASNQLRHIKHPGWSPNVYLDFQYDCRCAIWIVSF